MRSAMFGVLCIGVVFAGLAGLVGACSPARSAAEAADGAEQVRCVDRAATNAEALACQKAVRAKWAARDGGAYDAE